MNLLIVTGLCLDLAGAILFTIKEFTGKDDLAGGQLTLGKLGALFLACGFLLQLLAFLRV